MSVRSLCAGMTPALKLLVVMPDDSRFHEFRRVVSDCDWQVFRARTIQECREVIAERKIAVIFTDAHLPDGSWQNLLDSVHLHRDTPQVVVCSRTPDDAFWMEVLQLGGYDLIALPFQRAEVVHAAGTAFLSWQKRTAADRASALTPSTLRPLAASSGFEVREAVRA